MAYFSGSPCMLSTLFCTIGQRVLLLSVVVVVYSDILADEK